MSVVMRELVSVVPKNVWPYSTFSQITSDTCGELLVFCKQLGLSYQDLVNMRYHPHFKLSESLFVKALSLGAVVLTRQEYDSFVSINNV